MPVASPLSRSELELATGDPGSLALALADHHIEHISHDRAGDTEEDPGIGDPPAASFDQPPFAQVVQDQLVERDTGWS